MTDIILLVSVLKRLNRFDLNLERRLLVPWIDILPTNYPNKINSSFMMASVTAGHNY